MATNKLEAQITAANLSAHDAEEVRKFGRYLALEAAKREHPEAAGVVGAAQAVIYPDLYGEEG